MADYAAFIIVFTLALSLSLALGPLAIRLGQRLGITARPGGRRQTEGDRRRVSKLGGILLFGGFTVAILAAQLLPVPRMDPYEVIRLTGLVVGSIVIFITGILDDLFELPALPLFLAQSVATGIAISFQIFIEFFNNPLTGEQTGAWPFIVTVALSYFWIMGMTNTVNWLDGMDGLAGGVAFIAGAMLFINSAFRVQPAQTSVSLLPLALMGAALGFLLYNFYPGRIQMGGSAYYLGYLLGTLSIIGGAKMATILLVVGLPVIDVAWTITTRLRRGRNPAVGDREHLHYRLYDLGFSQRQIVLAYYSFCAFFGLLTLVTTSQIFKAVALGVMLFLVASGLFVLSRLHYGDSDASSASR